MKAVWKWAVPVDQMDAFRLAVPGGARFLGCQVQGTTPVLWALVDPEATQQERDFQVVGTGHRLDWLANWDYVGTFQLSGGRFVGHLFVKED